MDTARITICGAIRQEANNVRVRIADTSSQDERIEPPSKRWRYLAGGGALAVLAVAALLALPSLERWFEAEMSVSRERLRTATVERGDLVRDVSVQGRVVAAVSPTLYATQTGAITFAVEAGDMVSAGDVLAVIDSPELANRLEREEATSSSRAIEVERQRIQAKQRKLESRKTVDLAQVALTAARREARRADQAYATEAISQIDFEKAHDELRSAELAHEHAAADAELEAERLDFELRTLELALERQQLLVEDLRRQVDELSIRSPADGIVGNRLVDQKTAVSPNMPVLGVVDLSRFEVEAQVPESYADDLIVGLAAEVRIGQAAKAAMLVAVSPEVIDGQVTVRLRFDDDAGTVGLRQNQRLTTRVLLEAKYDVLRVTRGQFLESGGSRVAYVLDGDVARRRSIEIGARSLNAVEVLAGLDAGDEIIVSSIERFEGKETLLVTD